MAKFSKKPAAGDKGRSRSTSTRKAGADKEKPAGYKAKRSFSKNKSFRENKDTDKRKSFDRPFKKDYKKEKRRLETMPWMFFAIILILIIVIISFFVIGGYLK